MVSVDVEDNWATTDDTSYENPSDYDPNAFAEDDPAWGGDDPTYDGNDAAGEDGEDAEADSAGAGAGEDGDGDGEDEPAAKAKDPIEPLYANVFGWVDGFFAQVIRRRINPEAGQGLSWDERWWLYPEVVGRLTSLHYAWEEARADDKPSAMSSWWIHHLEPHIRIIFDGQTGPMALAKPDASWSGFPALGSEPVPPELRDIILGEPEPDSA